MSAKLRKRPNFCFVAKCRFGTIGDTGSHLFDELVGNREERRWDFQAKLTGGLKIDR